MTITFDIAATLTAIFWPLPVLAIFLAYRKVLPGLVNALLSRIIQFEVGGVSLDLAVAKPMVPDWLAGVLDLRYQAASIEINSSFTGAFVSMLAKGSKADCAEINFGAGQVWLTSRLFIMSIGICACRYR
jgi:hypothetical protein